MALIAPRGAAALLTQILVLMLRSLPQAVARILNSMTSSLALQQLMRDQGASLEQWRRLFSSSDPPNRLTASNARIKPRREAVSA